MNALHTEDLSYGIIVRYYGLVQAMIKNLKQELSKLANKLGLKDE